MSVSDEMFNPLALALCARLVESHSPLTNPSPPVKQGRGFIPRVRRNLRPAEQRDSPGACPYRHRAQVPY